MTNFILTVRANIVSPKIDTLFHNQVRSAKKTYALAHHITLISICNELGTGPCHIKKLLGNCSPCSFHILLSLFFHYYSAVRAEILANTAGNALIVYLHRRRTIYPQYIGPAHAFFGTLFNAQAASFTKAWKQCPKSLFHFQGSSNKGLNHLTYPPLQYAGLPIQHRAQEPGNSVRGA
ncbi:hypothetical protein SPSYN_00599 [Sporotomaculum syntrophicum]|uniref:Uncharacterized protein n=1 Tax=Sporotomaculum syntrophicum TaxID=182264 RepID=A0A9D3AWT7_9FIRM|nr:hypothetical protein SPSYN_00599 [Sporotomaculum syntrophicum]